MEVDGVGSLKCKNNVYFEQKILNANMRLMRASQKLRIVQVISRTHCIVFDGVVIAAQCTSTF